ncbi:MAG: glycoside hydrolase family 25 protein [Flexilinea sp.]|jgi:lysozyme
MAKRRALGIDISHWQGEVDFTLTKKAGASFVIVKASQNNWEDDQFARSWANAKRVKLLRGAYHFFDMREGSASAKEQGVYFASLLKNDMGELRPVLDFESPGINGYPEIPEHEEAVRIVTQFLQAFYQKTNVYPMLYTNLAGISRLAPLDEFLSSKELWIAWYYTKARTPKFGEWPGWRIWQYKSTGNGRAFGADSNGLDMNAFNGTEDDLYNYANSLGISKTKLKISKKVSFPKLPISDAPFVNDYQLMIPE